MGWFDSKSNTPQNKRFIEVYCDMGMAAIGNRILVDTQTGVMYLYHREINAGGLTVLVDRDGKPLLYGGGNPLKQND